MSVWLVCPYSLLPRPSSPWVRPVTLLHPYPRVLRKSTSRKARFTDYLTIRIQNEPIKSCSNRNYSLNVLRPWIKNVKIYVKRKLFIKKCRGSFYKYILNFRNHVNNIPINYLALPNLIIFQNHTH